MMAIDPTVIDSLTETTATALITAENFLANAHHAVSKLVVVDGRPSPKLLERHQFAAHGLSWVATYVEGLRQMQDWALRLNSAKKFGELEQLILQAAFGEYLKQLINGIAISQVEIVRPSDMGISDLAVATFHTDVTKLLMSSGNTDAVRMQIAELIEHGNFGNLGLGEETLDMIKEQFCRFTEEQVSPHAHEWHLKDELIPMSVVNQMCDLGVFGLTIAEEDGGLGMGKMAMCVVTEELSRGYIGVGSLSTRSEIAAELIRSGGTDEQKKKYLHKIASGEILPTAVFTEPNIGSDLASLKTRATLDGDTYKVTGNKTWITHASRTDMMTMLVRTNSDETGYKGLSMLLVEKPRGTDDDPFPKEGMTGGEIEVLGYRGMKEYELGFDSMEVPAEQLLGGASGQGFKQLMATFESARIQTAARAIGVAQNAMELGLKYATERQQFAKPIYKFPRIAGKIAWMAVETMIARQLTYFAAREKDSERRCDIEAGMAKLLAARVSWSNADNALQVHGGNGYALEYPISRVLCDARILNIFEGASEIQAHVIARGLLSGRN
jgi:(2S)-methylsuccinyl-CoA dehydrogenase